ncbi:hypothetical protein SAMN05444411_104206 [Lutibacter oricola]|uniref:DUF2141 domain-containing protein n=1 Tax=Lutibacter oricola TaxID=762486 RepID=A0A1H3ATQ0_9FLAO|nr:DUF2141 domain-containing protein [Lutibacter oricola]SDX32209.1 hypothetical protein SAMN05444411_104206 [Lutibacter oricola]
MQKIILTITLFFTLLVMGQVPSNSKLVEGQTIKVTVTNALSDKGTINFGLHSNKTFMKAEAIKAKSSKVVNGISTVIFENVPAGEYAIICFHDENENGRMDFEVNGMPKENYGTSNNPMSFGPPQFEPSKFEVKNEELFLEIKF